jgi:4-amino-4-deoxy-L-arabinose transferase-like glycosyltransferase
MVLWYLILVIATYFLGAEIGGRTGGVMAALIVTLDPNLIAHSTVTTVDVPFAALTALFMLCLIRMIVKPSVPGGVLVGISLGLLCSTKFTVLLFGVSLLLTLVWLPNVRPHLNQRRTVIPALAVAAVWTLVVIALMYAGRGLGVPLSDIKFQHAMFDRLATEFPTIRLPLPKEFLTGVDACLAEERNREWNVVILDQYFRQGIWYYFPLLWLLKTPFGVLGLSLVGFWGLLTTPRFWKDPRVTFLAANTALFLFYFCFVFKAQVGYRYVLFCLPLLAALAGRGWGAFRINGRTAYGIVGAGVLSIAEMVPFFTNPLSFTNLIVQPKRKAYLFVADSNLDWAQSGDAVGQWVRERGLEGAPSMPLHIVEGWNLIPVNFLTGVWWNHNQFRWVRQHLEPEELVASTTAAFNVSKSQFEEYLRVERTKQTHQAADYLCAKATGWAAMRGRVPFRSERDVVKHVCFRTMGATIRFLHTAKNFDLGYVDEFARPRYEYMEGRHTSWYRLEPGTYAFAVLSKEGDFRGDVELMSGSAEVSVID